MRIVPACLALAACGGDTAWGPVTYQHMPPVERVESATLPPRGSAGCADVVLAARAADRYAAWWEARPDGSSALMLARSADEGVSWQAPIVADGRDSGGLGCARPAPSLFADESSDYLHLTYHVAPVGSPGVYFTHSMKASALATTGEGVLHMPVAVTHGERPVRSSVAARGDTIVVAFEDPNSASPRILLAYSTVAGHVFAPYGAVSTPGSRASFPRVSLSADSMRVHWQEETAGGTRAAARSGTLP